MYALLIFPGKLEHKILHFLINFLSTPVLLSTLTSKRHFAVSKFDGEAKLTSHGERQQRGTARSPGASAFDGRNEGDDFKVGQIKTTAKLPAGRKALLSLCERKKVLSRQGESVFEIFETREREAAYFSNSTE
jgi:hypothetical protein